MGKLKIKKKDAVIPFRQTLAYRFILIVLSIFTLLFAFYLLAGALRANNTISFLIGLFIGVPSAFALYYNLDHLRDARIPARTLKKMKYR